MKKPGILVPSKAIAKSNRSIVFLFEDFIVALRQKAGKITALQSRHLNYFIYPHNDVFKMRSGIAIVCIAQSTFCIRGQGFQLLEYQRTDSRWLNTNRCAE